MSDLEIKQLRWRTAHFLSHEVASVADLRLEQLQQFVAGTLTLSDLQLRRLAIRVSMI
jgi:hypothetical protein